VEHAAEFEIRGDVLQPRDVLLQRRQRCVVAFGARELEQLVAVLQPGIEIPDGVDDVFELLLFLAEFLGPLLIVPDLGVFEVLRDDGEALRLDVEVKDTSAARPYAAADRRESWRAG
jgi:hypothetical protein